MKKSLKFLFILYFINSHAQITLHFKDALSKEPAPYIMVIDNKGQVITSSDESGLVYLDTKLDTIVIESVFYEKQTINIAHLEDNSTVILKPLVNTIDEVVLTSSRKPYLLIVAYYRISYKRNDTLVSFVDAEVKYIKKNNSFKKKVVNFRIFDTISKEKYKQINSFWVANLKAESLFETLNSKFYLRKKEGNDLIDIQNKKNSAIHGSIHTNLKLENGTNIRVEVVDDPKKYTNLDIEEYKSNTLLNTNITSLIYKCHQSTRDVTAGMIKITPELLGVKKLSSKREFFIQGVKYISKEEYKQIMKMGFKDNTVSHYTKAFWKDLKNFTPLDATTKKQLNELLTERKI